MEKQQKQAKKLPQELSKKIQDFFKKGKIF